MNQTNIQKKTNLDSEYLSFFCIKAVWCLSVTHKIRELLTHKNKTPIKLGLAPYNDLTKQVSLLLENEGNNSNITFFDLNPPTNNTQNFNLNSYSLIDFSTEIQVLPYKKVSLVDQIFIISPNFGNDIQETCLKYSTQTHIHNLSHELGKIITFKQAKSVIKNQVYLNNDSRVKKISNIINSDSKNIFFVQYINNQYTQNLLDYLKQKPKSLIICFDFDNLIEPYCSIKDQLLHLSIIDMIAWFLSRENKSYPNRQVIAFTMIPSILSGLTLLLKELVKNLVIITNLGDWLTSLYPFETDKLGFYSAYQDLQAINSEYKFFQHLLAHNTADGYIWSHDPNAKELKQIQKPIIYFPSSIETKNFYVPNLNNKNHLHPIILSLSTGDRVLPVPPDSHSHERHLYQGEYTKKLLKKGLSIVSYVVGNGWNIEKCQQAEKFYQPYLMKIMPAQPLAELIRSIGGKYQWGFLMKDPDERKDNVHYNVAISSKFFNYLALGLPLLCSPGFKAMASLIKKHKIGLVIEYKQLDKLPGLLTTLNYQQYQENVLIYRDKISPKQYFSKFDSLINDLSND